jgi:plastocyanin domain-containing protein
MKAKWLGGVIAAVFLAPLGALAAGQARTIEIAVTTKGFEPARVKVTNGEPLKLVVTRKTDDTCAKQIVIPDENIKADLPLNKPVTLSFTPKRTSEIKYACGLNMITGVIEVASSEAAGNPSATRSQRSGAMHGVQGADGMEGHHDATTHEMACGCMHRGNASNGS